MNPFRCSNCDKLLGMIEGKAEIKCPKCKAMNVYKPTAGVLMFPNHYTAMEDSIDKLTPWSKVLEPYNKTMLTFETEKADAFAGDIEIKVLDPITIKTIDHEHVTRMTRKEIEDKYGK